MGRMKWFAMLAATIAAPSAAQDAFMPAMSPMDLAPQTQALTSSVIGNLSVRETARQDDGAGSRRPGRPGRPALAAPSGSDAPLRYFSTPATRKRALDGYLARALRGDPTIEGKARAEFERQNVEGQMRIAMAPYGLRVDDAADVMTAFLIVGWEIMQGHDATSAQARALRRQVAGRLVCTPALQNVPVRTQFAEELKLTTFGFDTAAAVAKRDGKTASLRRVIAGYYQRQVVIDLARIRITANGFSY